MKIAQCMTRRALTIRPSGTLRRAAAAMAATGIGMLLVGDGERLLGVVTDRDIVIRGIGAGKTPETPVSEVMSESVQYCHVDDDVDRVAQDMAVGHVRRLPVLDREERLIGVVSVGDLAQAAHPDTIGRALREISRPEAVLAHAG